MKNIILFLVAVFSLGILVYANTFADMQQGIRNSIVENQADSVREILRNYTGSTSTTNSNVMQALRSIINTKSGSLNEFTRLYNFAVDEDIIQTKDEQGYVIVGSDRANLISLALSLKKDDIFTYLADDYFISGGYPYRFMIGIFDGSNVPPKLSYLYSKLAPKWQGKFTPSVKAEIILNFLTKNCEYNSYFKDFLNLVEPDEISRYFDGEFLYYAFDGGGVYGMNEKCIGATNIGAALIDTLDGPDQLTAKYQDIRIPVLAKWAIRWAGNDDYLDFTEFLLDKGSSVYTRVKIGDKYKTVLQLVDEHGTAAAKELVERYK